MANDPPPKAPPKPPPLRVARTGGERKTLNTYEHRDTVIVIFDKPFAKDDKPDKDVLELTSVGKAAKGHWKVRRSSAEDVDDTHVAIRFEHLKPGIYKLTRDDGRGYEARLFGGAVYPYQGRPGEKVDDPAKGLVGMGNGPAAVVPKRYFSLLETPPKAKDPDLVSKPLQFDKVVIREPEEVK